MTKQELLRLLREEYGEVNREVLIEAVEDLVPDEPEGELATKLRELAESQTDLDPEARHILYSRMRELYLK